MLTMNIIYAIRFCHSIFHVTIVLRNVASFGGRWQGYTIEPLASLGINIASDASEIRSDVRTTGKRRS